MGDDNLPKVSHMVRTPAPLDGVITWCGYNILEFKNHRPQKRHYITGDMEVMNCPACFKSMCVVFEHLNEHLPKARKVFEEPDDG